MSPSASFSQLRVLGRVSVAFILYIIEVGRADRDFLDTLITLAIVQANVTPLVNDRDLQRAYADHDSLPPDELRRPVSVSAVAHSLRLPYETVRRHVVRLSKAPGIELTAQGVVVGGESLNTPEHRALLTANHALVRDFYRRLRGLGALEGVAAEAARAPPPPGLAVRAVARVSSDYILRIVDLITVHLGDLVRGLVFLAVLCANTEHFTDDQRGGDGVDPGDFMPDALRRPVSVAAVAARLGVPHETVRRHAVRLVEDGMCQRAPAGLLVPAQVLARPNFVSLMGDNNAYVRRMFAQLARLGVVAEWERTPATAQAGG